MLLRKWTSNHYRWYSLTNTEVLLLFHVECDNDTSQLFQLCVPSKDNPASCAAFMSAESLASAALFACRKMRRVHNIIDEGKIRWKAHPVRLHAYDYPNAFLQESKRFLESLSYDP